MDSLKSLDFSSFIIFPDDPWSLLVSFCQLFKLPLVVQCCNVICEWPLKYHFSEEASFHFLYLQISTYLLSKQTKKNLVTELSDSHRAGRGQGMLKWEHQRLETANCQGPRPITSFVQYNRPSLPVLFWRVVFRNRTGWKRFVGGYTPECIP